MGLFNLYKPREYNYRYIYYDPKKDAAKEREKKANGENEIVPEDYKPTLHRGIFREMAQKNNKLRTEQVRQSNLRLIMIIALLLAITYFLLK